MAIYIVRTNREYDESIWKKSSELRTNVEDIIDSLLFEEKYQLDFSDDAKAECQLIFGADGFSDI